MIDQLGYKDDAIAKAAELGGIKGTPRTIEYKSTSNFIEILSQSANRSTLPTMAEIMNLIGAPKLEARWFGP
jgi:ClpP class serine protease